MSGPATHLGHDEASDAIAAIWTRSREGALARVALLEEAVAALIENRLCEDSRRAAEREAHRLAGSAGSFGFHRASQAARQLEWTFAGTEPVAADRMLKAADEVVALRADLDRVPAPAPDHHPRRESDTRGLIVAVNDGPHRDRIVVAATASGFRPIALGDLTQFPAGDDTVTAALVDLGLPGGAALRLIAQLSASDPAVPSLALTPTDGFCDRVEAARAGARGFMGASAPPEELLAAVEELLARPRVADSTILVVDDDPAILEAVHVVLDTAGLRVVTLDDPAQFWAVLAEEGPDLVILDLDMPNVSGDELCRVVRSDPDWAGLPILFLTARSDPSTVAEMFAAGADDFVAKPFSGPELGARVRNRLERTRLLRAFAETDPLTGLASRRHGEPDLQTLLGLAERHGQPFSIAMLDLDLFKLVNDSHGHATGDAVLRRVGSLLRSSFRREDVVARWGGEEFLLGMYGMTRDDAVQQVATVLERLRGERFLTPSGPPISVTFSAGVASYPDDASSVPDLCDAADQALYRAKRHGRDRVLPAAPADAEHEVDVVIVEDDDALAELLEHALTTRGYRFRHFANGQDAAHQLAASPPVLQARVVLLDVNLPVLNGFGVLRQMATAGALAGTRVIMLTARSSEHEVLEALELGAFDHVAKPFSVPVLMQRIRRALGT